MKVILDECLPRRLGAHLTGHAASTVPMAGYAGLSNGELLRALSGNCDAFVTVDSGMEHQQNLGSYPFMTILVRTRSNRLADLLPFVPTILVILAAGTQPGAIHHVG